MKIDNLVLLAGGLATRLKPVTETIPKSMLDINGKPFIAHQLELLRNKGIQKVIICAGYLGEKIQDHVKDGSDFGLKVEYSFDGDKLLGTGGAIKKALPNTDDIFFVMYGDSYLNTDFEIISDYFFKKRAIGLMTVFRNEGKWDKSNIDFAGGKILAYDKKGEGENLKFIDYGLGVLNKTSFIDFMDKDIFDLEEVYQILLKKNELEGFEVKERFYEIGSFRGLDETSNYLLNNNQQP